MNITNVVYSIWASTFIGIDAVVYICTLSFITTLQRNTTEKSDTHLSKYLLPQQLEDPCLNQNIGKNQKK